MLYVYEGCCGNTSHERRCRLREYLDTPEFKCPKCGRGLKQWVTTSALVGTSNFSPFKSPVDGSIVASKRDLAEHNRRNKVVNVHDGYDDKAVMSMINKDFQKPLDEERKKDLQKDMETSVQKLYDGYKPETPQYQENIA